MSAFAAAKLAMVVGILVIAYLVMFARR